MADTFLIKSCVRKPEPKPEQKVLYKRREREVITLQWGGGLFPKAGKKWSGDPLLVPFPCCAVLAAGTQITHDSQRYSTLSPPNPIALLTFSFFVLRLIRAGRMVGSSPRRHGETRAFLAGGRGTLLLPTCKLCCNLCLCRVEVQRDTLTYRSARYFLGRVRPVAGGRIPAYPGCPVERYFNNEEARCGRDEEKRFMVYVGFFSWTKQ